MHLQESVYEMKKFNARRKLKVSGCAVKGLDLHNGVFPLCVVGKRENLNGVFFLVRELSWQLSPAGNVQVR